MYSTKHATYYRSSTLTINFVVVTWSIDTALRLIYYYLRKYLVELHTVFCPAWCASRQQYYKRFNVSGIKGQFTLWSEILIKKVLKF